MNTDITMRSIIEQYVRLYPVNARGWHPCVHQGCDHGKKGPRAAFIFSTDSVGFHCFNCAAHPSYNENDGIISDEFKKILNDFSIPEDAWQPLLFKALQNKDNGKTKTKRSLTQITQFEPAELILPTSFYQLSEAPDNDKWAIIANDYLEYERHILPSSYPFYLSEKTNDKHLAKWYKRLIIPMYKEGKLIFYQGRRLLETMPKKYESPSTESNKVLGCFDNALLKTEVPLIVVEGWFDAFAVDGVAVIGNTISKEQIYWINKSPRKKIYVPDKTGKGYIAAKQALDLGWEISVPDFTDCKDTSDAVKRFGKLYTLKSIIDSSCSGFSAELQIKFLEQNR